MRVNFRFLHVQHLPDRIVRDPSFVGDRTGFSALQGGLSYQELIPPQPLDSDTSCLLGTDAFRDEMARIWKQACDTNMFLPSGSLELRNLVGFGSQALLLDLEHKLALVGGAVNWGIEYARQYVSTCAPACGPVLHHDQNGFEIEMPADIAIERQPGLLMMSPGQDIYGHWLLDYAPRLLLASLMHGPATPRYYFHELPRWAPSVLAAFGVPESAVVAGPRPLFMRYPLAAMPSATKEGFRVVRPVNRMAWLRLKHMLLGMPIAEEERSRLPEAKRIFVSRKNWGTVRTIGNAQRLEEIALERGFVPVRPEEFSMPAQARIFQTARVVLGEDGSGLHNVMFGELGCVLGVISVFDRINLWHMAICQHLGHKLCYTAAEKASDGVRAVNEAAYHGMIDLLDAAAARA